MMRSQDGWSFAIVLAKEDAWLSFDTSQLIMMQIVSKRLKRSKSLLATGESMNGIKEEMKTIDSTLTQTSSLL